VNGINDTQDALHAEAAERGIVVWILYRGGEMSATSFSDGFHRYAQGATPFTKRLAPELSRVLAKAEIN
jgi:hypothetical protein